MRGRPTMYEKKFIEQLEPMGKRGLSQTQMAAELGVCKSTFYNWKNEHPEFLDAVKKALSYSQAYWETQLHNAALGINQEEAQANPTLMIFQMKNRFADDWREKQTTEHEVVGAKKVVVEWGE